MQGCTAEGSSYNAFCEALSYSAKTAFVFGEVVLAFHSFKIVCQESKRLDDEAIYELFPFFWASDCGVLLWDDYNAGLFANAFEDGLTCVVLVESHAVELKACFSGHGKSFDE